MQYLFFTLLFLFGIAVGSLLNVLIIRYKPGGRFFDLKNLGGRSHCPACGRTLSASELVPVVSFFALGGKCKTCRAPISWQYPVVEFLSGAIFAGVPFFLNAFFRVSTPQFISFSSPRWYYGLVLAWVMVFVSWLVLWVIDQRHLVIPNGLTLFLFILGTIITGIIAAHSYELFPFRASFLENYALVFSPFQNPIANHLLGSVAAGSFFLLIFLISGGRGIGMGDAKLAFAAGMVIGWPDIALALILSFIIGGAWGAFLLFAKKKTMRDQLAFGPLLALGFLLTFFFGHAIVAGYFGMFGL